MARIQVLELPTIYRPEGPDETPFILIIDEVSDPDAYVAADSALRDEAGARAVLVCAERIDIPANEVTVGPDGTPIRMHFEGDFSQLYEQADQVAKDLAKRFKLGSVAR